MPNPAVFPAAEEEEAGGGLRFWSVLSPGPGGQHMLFQRFSPGWGLQVGLTGPVGMSALRAAEAELPPAGVIQRDDELPPGTAHLAAATQVRQRQVG